MKNTLLLFVGFVTFAVAALAQTRFNVVASGAVGDGVTNDTVAIQSAITAAVSLRQSTGKPTIVYLPAGLYFVDQTLTIPSSGVSIEGDGLNSSILVRSGDYGDTLVIGSSGNTYGGGNNVSRLAIKSTGTVSHGAHLVTLHLSNSSIRDVALAGGHQGLRVENCYTMVYDGLLIRGGGNFAGTGVVAGSSFITIKANADPEYASFDLLFSNLDCRGTEASGRIEHGLDIKQCDGIWFNNGHVIGAFIECYINPAAGYLVQNLQFSNMFFDGNCTAGLQIVGTGSVRGVRFNGGVFGGASGAGGADAVAINCAGLRGLLFDGVEFGSNNAGVLNLIAGTYIDVKNSRFLDNVAVGSGSNCVSVWSGCSKVNISGCTFGRQFANNGILVGGATVLRIADCQFSEIPGLDIAILASGANTFISNNSGDKIASVTQP